MSFFDSLPDSEQDWEQQQQNTVEYNSSSGSVVFGRPTGRGSTSGLTPNGTSGSYHGGQNTPSRLPLFNMFPEDGEDEDMFGGVDIDMETKETAERLNQFSESLPAASQTYQFQAGFDINDPESFLPEDIFHNRSDDETYCDIIEQFNSIQETVSPQQRFKIFSKLIRDISFKKLDILESELERNFFLPNKKDIDRQTECLRSEVMTWALIGKLYDYRDIVMHEEEQEQVKQREMERQGDEMMVDGGNAGAKLKKFDQTSKYQDILVNNSMLREMSIVINWLQEMSSNLEFNDHIVLWKRTFNALKERKKGENIVNELDPDAQSRTNLDLERGDEDEENKFFIALWMCIRAGDLERAKHLCVSLKQSWRAQTMIGWQKSNYSEESMGNPYNNLYRANCFQISERAKNIYERAIYASFCGNVEPLTSVSKDWYDFLWSHLICSFNTLIFEELDLYKSPLALEEDIPLPKSKLGPVSNTREILSSLKNCPNTDVKNQAKSPYHMIQEHVINNEYHALLETCLKFMKGQCQGSAEFYRFAVNLILFYRSREVDPNRQLVRIQSLENEIIMIHINHLMEKKLISLVAFYTSLLTDEDLKVRVYAEFLTTVKPEERAEALSLAERAKLNTNNIARAIVSRLGSGAGFSPLLASQPTNVNNNTKNTNDPTATTAEDLNKIQSLTWLTHEGKLYIEAIERSNQLFREFIVAGKVDACEKTAEQLPEAIVTKAMEFSQHPNTDNIVKEYNDFKNYMRAFHSINTYNQHFSKKPVQPNIQVPLPQAAYSVRLNYERTIKAYEAQFEEWNQLNQELGSDAVQSIKTVIKTKWLAAYESKVNFLNENDPYQAESSVIRKKIIPQLFTSLFFIYTNTNQLIKSISLSNKIVDEKLQWYSVFTKSQLQEILTKIKDNFTTIL